MRAKSQKEHSRELLKSGRQSDFQIISKEGTVHKVHSAILYLNSRFFQQWLSGISPEAERLKVTFFDVSDSLLVRAIRSMYGLEPEFIHDDLSDDADEYKDAVKSHVVLLKLCIGLYNLGERLGMDYLKHEARETFNRVWRDFGKSPKSMWSGFDSDTKKDNADTAEDKEPDSSTNEKHDGSSVNVGAATTDNDDPDTNMGDKDDDSSTKVDIESPGRTASEIGESSRAPSLFSLTSDASGHLASSPAPFEYEGYPESFVEIFKLVYDITPATTPSTDRGLRDIVLSTLQDHTSSGRYLRASWQCVKDLIEQSTDVTHDLALRRFSEPIFQCDECFDKKQRHVLVPCNDHTAVLCKEAQCVKERKARSSCQKCGGIGCITDEELDMVVFPKLVTLEDVSPTRRLRNSPELYGDFNVSSRKGSSRCRSRGSDPDCNSNIPSRESSPTARSGGKKRCGHCGHAGSSTGVGESDADDESSSDGGGAGCVGVVSLSRSKRGSRGRALIEAFREFVKAEKSEA